MANDNRWIDDKHKFVYIHIPKTGGLTIKKVFGLNKGTLHSLPTRIINKDVWENYYTFTFVRHPIDKLLSTYFFLTGKRYSELRKKQTKTNDMGFREFIQYKRRKHNDVDFMNQIEYIRHTKSKMPINFIGRYEYFERDIRHLLNEFNLKQKEIPRLNSSPRDLSLIDIDIDLLKDLINLWKKDFDYFNYNSNINYISKTYLGGRI